MKAHRFGIRMFTYYLVFAFLSLIFMFMVLNTPRPLQYVIMTGLLAGFGLVLFNDGGVTGEKAVTMRELINKRRAEGHMPDVENEAVSFKKKTAVIALLIAAAPLFLMAVVNIIYHPFYVEKLDAYEIKYGPVEEQWAREADPFALENGNLVFPADVSDAPLQQPPPPPINYVTVVTRVLFSPFIVYLSSLEGNLMTYNLLLLLFPFIFPAFGAAGYLNGPRFHQKKLAAIEMGVKKKLRKMKRERANRQYKEPKREV